jgi:hypothetical protein
MRLGILTGDLIVVVTITELMPLINVNKEAALVFGVSRLWFFMHHQGITQRLGVFSSIQILKVVK